MIKIQKKITGDLITMYSGFYKGTRVCIDQNKDRIVSYMEFHRRCNPTGYTIEKEKMMDTIIYMHYEDIVMDNLYGSWLPMIDINYILKDVDHIIDDYAETINRLAMIGLMFKKAEMKEEQENVENTINSIYNTITTDKLSKKLIKTATQIHPIMIMPMDQYLKFMKGYRELREMDHRYKIAMLTD